MDTPKLNRYVVKPWRAVSASKKTLPFGMMNNMKPQLFTMMGYPGAGKSTFARKLATKLSIIRISSDALRAAMFADIKKGFTEDGYAELFGAMDYAVTEVLKSGNCIVYDAKCNRRSERQKNAQVAESADGIHITIWVKAPRSESLARTTSREEADGAIRFDAARIALHANDTLEKPDEDEPAIIIDGRAPFGIQYKSFTEQLHQLVTVASVKISA